MTAKRKYEEQREDVVEDDFLADDAYDRYHGEDLSDDPMLVDEKKRSVKLTKKERAEQERRHEEKERLKEEILAELRAEQGSGNGAGKYTAASTDEGSGGDSDPAVGKPAPPSRFTTFLMSFLSGNILSRQEVRRAYPYLLFIAFLAFIYIGNVFRMQHLYRRHESLTVEVRELRDKSMTIASEKMRSTRQSNIIREIERRGIPLKESLTPNRTIQR